MSKVTFRKPFQKVDRVPTNAGTRIKFLYGYELNKKGQKELVITGEEDQYETIQSYAEDVKIENILNKVASGQMSAHVNGIYEDIVDVPKNIHEARAAMIKVENLWNNLDAETRAKFDNSLEIFVDEAAKESWHEKLPFNKEATEEAPILEETPKIDTTPKEVNS